MASSEPRWKPGAFEKGRPPFVYDYGDNDRTVFYCRDYAAACELADTMNRLVVASKNGYREDLSHD